MLITFDIAGTLMEDSGNLVKSFISALEINGVKVDEREIEELRGASKLKVIKHLMTKHRGGDISEDEITKTYSLFKELLEDSYRKEEIKPIFEVDEALKWLKNKNILLATTTGFYRNVRDLILKKLSWDGDFFHCNVCSDDVSEGRPAPYMIFQCMSILKFHDVKQVLAIGDTPLDLQAGCNAGCGGVIGVLTGAHGIKSLGMTRHTHIIPSVADLPELIKKEF